MIFFVIERCSNYIKPDHFHKTTEPRFPSLLHFVGERAHSDNLGKIKEKNLITRALFVSLLYLQVFVFFGIQRQIIPCKYFTLYTSTSAFIFSTLFSLHFLRYGQGEFVWQSRAFWISDHFLCSRDLYIWFKGKTVRRN